MHVRAGQKFHKLFNITFDGQDFDHAESYTELAHGEIKDFNNIITCGGEFEHPSTPEVHKQLLSLFKRQDFLLIRRGFPDLINDYRVFTAFGSMKIIVQITTSQAEEILKLFPSKHRLLIKFADENLATLAKTILV